MKRVLVLLMAMAMLVTTSGIAEGALALDQTSVTMDYSQTVTLTAANGGESVRWTSSDEGVARLSANYGESIEVMGIHEGAATVTCTLGEQQQSCEVMVTAPSTLQIMGVDYPSTYRMAGRGWKLRRGVLASNVDLTTLTTVLKAEDGTVVGSAYTYTFGSGVRRYEINGLDNYVPFARISSEGAYTWTLMATDVSGRMVSVSLPINAVSEGETTISNEPGAQSATAVSGIALGDALTAGRNLILNSDFSGMTDAGIYKFDGDEVTFSASDFIEEGTLFRVPLSEYGIENIRGKTLLLSMEYRVDEALEFGTTDPWVGFQAVLRRDETTGGKSQALNWYGETSIPAEVTEDWVQYVCMAHASDYDVLDTSSIGIFFRDTKGTIRFRHPKIEIIDTGWSLAPEDVG